MSSKRSSVDAVSAFAQGWRGTEKGNTSMWIPDSGIEGVVPLNLRGTFFRNGPGIDSVYGVKLVHPIDGDGMISRVTFVNGRVHFMNKFVETAHRVKEQAAQKMLFPGQMGTRTAETLGAKFRDPSHTNVFEWGGVLVSTFEYDLPHLLDPTTLETVKRSDLGGAIVKSVSALSAHFRYDQHEDCIVTCSFKPGVAAFLQFDRAWKCVRSLHRKLPGCNYIHDFQMTRGHFLVHMSPFVKLSVEGHQQIMRGTSSPGEQMQCHRDLPSRILMFDRTDAAAPVQSFDIFPCHIYHFGWCVVSSDDVIRLDGCCLPENMKMVWQHELALTNAIDAPGLMYSFELRPKSTEETKERVSWRVADAASCEFPTIHPFRNIAEGGRGTARFTYTMACDDPLGLPYRDVVKVDADGGPRRRWRSPGGSIGEPAFIPRLGLAAAAHGAEDDGWVLVQEFTLSTGKTSFVLLEAPTMGFVCRINLGFFLTNGFHGTWSTGTFIAPPLAKL